MDEPTSRRSVMKRVGGLIVGGAAVIGGSNPVVGQATCTVQSVPIGEYTKIDRFGCSNVSESFEYQGLGTVSTDVIPAQNRVIAGASHELLGGHRGNAELSQKIRFDGESPQRMRFTHRVEYKGFLRIDLASVVEGRASVVIESRLNRDALAQRSE